MSGTRISYAQKIASNLSSIFHSVIRTLGMSSQAEPEYPELDAIGGSRTLEIWEALAITQLNELEDCYQRYINPRSMTVLRLRQFKSKSIKKFQHECVVAEVRLHGRRDTVLIRLERSVSALLTFSDEKKLYPGQPPQQNPPPNSSLESVRSSVKLWAFDALSVLRRWPSKILTTEVVLSGSPPFSMYDLLLAAKVVHQHSPIFDPFRRQCFWFSKYLILVVKAQDPGSIVKKYDLATEASVFAEEGINYNPGVDGTYCGMLITKEIEETRIQLSRLFMEARQKFDKDVSTLFNCTGNPKS